MAMTTGTLPRLAEVRPGAMPLTLRLLWRTGDETVVDVSGMVATFRLYAPLRADGALFAQVRVGEHGTDVVWTDEIDMSADTLWRLGQEQAGQAIAMQRVDLGAATG